MRVIYTDEALADLEAILRFIASHYPAAYAPFERRLRTVAARTGAWPESAQEVAQRPGVRVVPLIRYPYNRRQKDAVEVLHVHHAARRAPWEEK